MTSVEDRRRAREAYEQALAKQRNQNAQVNVGNHRDNAGSSIAAPPRNASPGGRSSSLSLREQMLEDRRRQYLEKKSMKEDIIPNPPRQEIDYNVILMLSHFTVFYLILFRSPTFVLHEEIFQIIRSFKKGQLVTTNALHHLLMLQENIMTTMMGSSRARIQTTMGNMIGR